MKNILIKLHSLLNKTQHFDFVAPLLLRLYLVPVFWMAGTHKFNGFDSIVEWFGNTEWGLGLPFPFLMALLATFAELVGSIALLFGVAVRWFSIPLMITMLVSTFTVHWKNGWQAISDVGAPFANERVQAAADKLTYVKEVVTEHANYDYLTSSGNLVISNNGIEFSITYFVMLFALLMLGAGRYVSVDYWFTKKLYAK